MEYKDIKNWDEKYLQGLIEEKVFESKELDYKAFSFPDGKMSDECKNKLAKEIAALGNTNGGVIIIGIKEDDHRLPSELIGAGLTLAEYDEWMSSFKQLLFSRIRPHLHGIEPFPIVLNNETIAIVVYVPKSYSRPHSFWDGNKDTFYMRNTNGLTYMDIDDLRKQFIFYGSIKSEIQNFRRDRISMILADDIIGNMGSGAKLVLHIIPEWSFELGNSIDITKIKGNENFIPMSGNGWNPRYNADGYCIVGKDFKTKNVDSYAQIFHSGIIEIVEVRLFSGYAEKQVYEWEVTQGAIIKAVVRTSTLLEQFNVPKPWHVFTTLLNAKGYFTNCGGWTDSEIIDRDIVVSLDGIWSENDDVDVALKPVLDSLSNAFGLSSSPCYDKDGKINYI